MRPRRIVRRAVRPIIERVGFDVVSHSIYSPVPLVEPKEHPVWSEPQTALAGIELDLDAQFAFVERELAPFVPELGAPDHRPAGGGFHLANDWYQAVDAELLYALLRHLQPRRMLELGSGYSTLVAAQAARANAGEGRPLEVTSVDAAPRESLLRGLDGVVRLERGRAEQLPLARFDELARGDVLFVDTSHTVKHGSEVNWLVLDVLPRLAPGVVVHFHDVFLPYAYPREWLVDEMMLAEQYLIQAFLSGNPDWRVLVAAHALARAERERLARTFPSLTRIPNARPAALWLERLG
jgi:predicted O-methyltransferase YrrM